MANKNELVTWILSNAEYLKLEIYDLTWTQDILPGFREISVQISCGGRQYVGYGLSVDDDTALVKGFAEAAERAIIIEHQFATSSGVAAHIDLESAKYSASDELIERDRFLCHFYTQTPFSTANVPAEGLPWIKELKKWYVANRIDFQIFDLGMGGILFVASGDRASRRFGYVWGAAKKRDINESLLSAAVEATRQISHLVLNKESVISLSLEEFLSLPEYSFPDHGRLALNLEYASRISSLFKGPRSPVVSDSANPQIYVQELKTDIKELKSCPLKYARAISKDVQEIFLGPPRPEMINLSRLSRFVGRTIAYEELSPLPHPFN